MASYQTRQPGYSIHPPQSTAHRTPDTAHTAGYSGLPPRHTHSNDIHVNDRTVGSYAATAPNEIATSTNSLNDGYATIADRLLALRATQKTPANSATASAATTSITIADSNTARYGPSLAPTSNGVPPSCSRRNSADSDNSRRSGLSPRDRDQGLLVRAQSPKKTQLASRAIRLFVGGLYLTGVPMLVVGIILICLPDKADYLYNAGLVLLILASVVVLAAVILSILIRCGLCKQNTHTVIQVHRTDQTQTIEAPTKPQPEPMYHPQPAPGYHTPLPFGPTVPGYIPPQVVFSKYANKTFNHRAILAGTDTPVSEDNDDVPAGFPAYPPKSPRVADGPSGGMPFGSPQQGPSTRHHGLYTDC